VHFFGVEIRDGGTLRQPSGTRLLLDGSVDISHEGTFIAEPGAVIDFSPRTTSISVGDGVSEDQRGTLQFDGVTVIGNDDTDRIDFRDYSSGWTRNSTITDVRMIVDTSDFDSSGNTYSRESNYNDDFLLHVAARPTIHGNVFDENVPHITLIQRLSGGEVTLNEYDGLPFRVNFNGIEIWDGGTLIQPSGTCLFLDGPINIEHEGTFFAAPSSSSSSRPP
jgi:hypothetical protein